MDQIPAWGAIRHQADANGPYAADRIAEILPHTDRHADWRPVRGLFRQQVQLLRSGSKRIPGEIREAFAEAIERISASYTGEEARLCEHVLAILADVECREIFDLDLFRSYYEDERFNPAPKMARSSPRRQPGLYEAVVETCRRIRDARSFRAACRNTGTSGLLTGSTSYGRFYNVRGNRSGIGASDLDFIIVIEQAEALNEITAALSALPGVAHPDCDHFVRRAGTFASSLYDGGTVFSHKIQLWADGTPDPVLPTAVASGSYMLSLHIMTRSVLDYVLVMSAPRLLKEAAGACRTLKDYREAPAVRWDDLYDFSGRRHRESLDAMPAPYGWLRSPRVYYIDESDCYFPGFYQTMLFPLPDLLWDDLDIRAAVNEFQRKLGERVRYEITNRAHTMLRPSFAHVRSEVFTPSVTKLLDDSYSGS